MTCSNMQQAVELGADGQTALHRLVARGELGALAQWVEFAKTMGIDERHVERHLLSMMMSMMTEFHQLVKHGNDYNNLFFPRADVSCLYNRANSILLETRGVVNVVDSVKRSLLHVAVLEHQADCVEYLLEQKALVDSQDSFGVTPVEYAIGMRSVQLVNMLAPFVGINRAFLSGETMLHKVATRGHVPMAQRLVELGANIELLNAKGESPLFYAVYAMRVEMIEYLLSLGARTSVTNNKGITCLDLARKSSNPKVKSLLLRSDSRQ
jgi:ankyrin repeat protein